MNLISKIGLAVGVFYTFIFSILTVAGVSVGANIYWIGNLIIFGACIFCYYWDLRNNSKMESYLFYAKNLYAVALVLVLMQAFGTLIYQSFSPLDVKGQALASNLMSVFINVWVAVTYGLICVLCTNSINSDDDNDKVAVACKIMAYCVMVIFAIRAFCSIITMNMVMSAVSGGNVSEDVYNVFNMIYNVCGLIGYGVTLIPVGINIFIKP